MEVDWLETFLAVVDSGGFTSASVQVHRSQSRVSAHIAALEKELGMLLIDRTRRPATATAAGALLAVHARAVLAEIATARSALSVLRAMQSDSLSVLTTSGIAAAFLPSVLTAVLARHPGATVEVSQRGRPDGEVGDPTDGFAIAVLPTLALPHPPGLREKLLWREPLRVVVPADHELARSDEPVDPGRLVRYPLVVGSPVLAADAEFPAMLAGRGLSLRPRATVEDPRTLAAMVGRGLGVGLEYAVALEYAVTRDLVVLDIDDPDLVSEVAAYWHDTLLTHELGQMLHRAVLDSPLPSGASPIGPAQWPRPASGVDPSRQCG